MPITDHVVDESGVSRFKLPTVRAAAPRFGPDYVSRIKGSSRRAVEAQRRGSEIELWKGSEGAVPYAPAVSKDGDPDLLRCPQATDVRAFS